MSSLNQSNLIAPSSTSHEGEAAQQPSAIRDASTNLVHDNSTSSDTDGGPKRQALTSKPALHPCKVFSNDMIGRPYRSIESRLEVYLCLFYRISSADQCSGRSGRLKDRGFLLPGNYLQALFADGMDWVCPIRSCRQPCFTMAALADHWRVCPQMSSWLRGTLLTVHHSGKSSSVSSQR